jgi:hypothetical protein
VGFGGSLISSRSQVDGEEIDGRAGDRDAVNSTEFWLSIP